MGTPEEDRPASWPATLPARLTDFASGSRPAVVTADVRMRDDFLRIAATTRSRVEIASDFTEARSLWRSAPLVVVGEDVAGGLAAMAMPRRPSVVVVGYESPDCGGAVEERGRRSEAIWRHAVDLGAEQVLFMPSAEPWLADLIGDAVDRTDGRGTVLAVVGGCGGAGASTLAAGLAVAATGSGHRVALIDGDPQGGGLDLLLGVDEASGLRWPAFFGLTGRVSGRSLVTALPQVKLGVGRAFPLLSWGRDPYGEMPDKVMSTVLRALRRTGDLGLIVVDLARAFDVSAEAVMAQAAAVLVVTRPDLRAVAASRQIIRQVSRTVGDVRLVLRLPTLGALSPAEVVQELETPLAGLVGEDRSIAATREIARPSADEPAGPVAAFCRGFIDSFTAENADAAPVDDEERAVA